MIAAVGARTSTVVERRGCVARRGQAFEVLTVA